MNKRFVRLIALIACILLLTSCSQQQVYPDALPESSATPPPCGEDEPRTIEARLYFAANDGKALEVETRSVRIEQKLSSVHAVLEALSNGPSDSRHTPVVPDTLKYDRCELAGDICNVYFTGAIADDEILILRAAIAATISAAQGTAYIDVFINDVQPGYRGRPLGPLSPISVSLEDYIANMEQEYALPVSSLGEAETLETLNAALYFSDVAGELLLCDVRSILYSKSADQTLIVSALLSELMKGPLNSEGREWILPTDMRLKKVELVGERLPTEPVEDGQEEPGGEEPAPGFDGDTPKIVVLYFERPQAFEKQEIAFASLAYTITGFLPNVGGVRVYLSGELEADMTSEIYADQPGTYARNDFSAKIGQLVRLYFPDKNGQGLYLVRRSIPQYDAYDPMARLLELFSGAADPGVRIDAFGADDILSVSRVDNIMVVNFAPGFHNKLSSFLKTSSASVLPAHTRARMFVYSIVNTLCAMPGTSCVWMLENGSRINETVDMIYLGGPLYENPGLVLS